MRLDSSRYTARRPSQTPKFGHTAFLAVNEREVALIKTGGGGLKNGSAEVRPDASQRGHRGRGGAAVSCVLT